MELRYTGGSRWRRVNSIVLHAGLGLTRNRFLRKVLLLLIVVSVSVPVYAQGPTATLSGKVTDQTGAVIPQATVVVAGADGKQTTATTNQEGAFEIRALPPGSYNVRAGAKGFAVYRKDGVTLSTGQTQTLNVSLDIQTKAEKVEVQEEGTQFDVGSSSNAGSLIIKGKDLEALSDDPAELQSELQAHPGRSA